MYGKPSYLQYLEDFFALVKESGNSRVGLAYRWVVKKLDEMWKGIEADAPGDNSSTYKKLREAGAF